jgi:hypothetical protein
MNKKQSNSGQIVLVVLLTMIVGLTIALSIFLNSLSDTSMTITEEQSEGAFGIAEAGIEELLYLSNSTDILSRSGDSISIGDMTADITATGDTTLEATIPRNSVATVQLKNSEGNPVGGSVTILWTKTGTDEDNSCPATESPDNSPAGLIIAEWVHNGGINYKAYKPQGCNYPSDGTQSIAGADGFRSQIDSFPLLTLNFCVSAQFTMMPQLRL